MTVVVPRKDPYALNVLSADLTPDGLNSTSLE